MIFDQIRQPFLQPVQQMQGSPFIAPQLAAPQAPQAPQLPQAAPQAQGGAGGQQSGQGTQMIMRLIQAMAGGG